LAHFPGLRPVFRRAYAFWAVRRHCHGPSQSDLRELKSCDQRR
jgi:hypothetical protein